MQPQQIPAELILRSGGDWGQYGELTGPQLVTMMNTDRLRVVFANDSLLVWVQRSDGTSGTYRLVHTEIQAIAAVQGYTNETVALAANAPLKNVQNNWPTLYKTMVQYNVASPRNCAAIIGTIAQETGSFLPVREAFYLYDPDPAVAEILYKQNPTPAYNWYSDTTSHAPYEGGPDYHGRGYIQLTHKSNYQKVQDATGMPVVANPDLLLQPEAAAHALCIFWTGKGIQDMAEAGDWNSVRRAVYGAGDPAGVAKIAHAAQVLGVA